MQEFFAVALQRSIATNAVRISLFVGTVLNLINQGGTVLSGDNPSWPHVVLNYVVPYCVATYSAVRNEMKHERGRARLAPCATCDTECASGLHAQTPESAPLRHSYPFASGDAVQEAPGQSAVGGSMAPLDPDAPRKGGSQETGRDPQTS